MDEQQFNEKYWYSNTKIITVANPRSEDYIFQATTEVGVDMVTGKMKSETRQYRVAAGKEERFPGPIANMYLDQMAKLVAQDEEKIQFMIDYALKAQYYDDLIVGIEDLINTYQSHPAYLDKPETKPEAVNTTLQTEEEPFAAVKAETAARKPGRPPKAVAEA